jgi:hypothetical protein
MVTPNPDDGALWEAYRSTVFVAMMNGRTVRIHVDRTNPELDDLLKLRGVTTWAFITAWNPASQQLPREANDVRHEQLKEDVSRLNLQAFEGQGEPEDSDWTPERSLLVAGISEPDAIRLGLRYGQIAIVVGEVGREATLLKCAPDV